MFCYLGQSVGVSLGGLCIGVIGSDGFLAFGAIGVSCVAIGFGLLLKRHRLTFATVVS